ncbi:RraA family protein [filamentous cyanobacterium LEGE 11480]|uniref:Putative 4-hydroxy-4-methyl-2-oxoglutarate aldolase n=1 Tax=Romeriopsis navalis LEGE 11480 TaxID=2777977 RepID=A0A928VN01_9CYAN|nr:RraA family protein [Romeriopsis navalis]MBE9028949.1 RraA family protein [Romeriopsis navalis LEGE 11480]
MTDYEKFRAISPTAYADALARENCMDFAIRQMWTGMPRIAGSAYTVRCVAGDNLMLHAAMYRAAPGSVLVVDAGDASHAVSGGNVCAVAQKLGLAGFVIDGVIRDVAEVRECGFPVFARGVIPKPGGKQHLGDLQQPIVCGGVAVNPGDVVVADEEGIVVIPQAQLDTVYQAAQARADQDAAQSLEAWQALHRAKIDRLLQEKGFQPPD